MIYVIKQKFNALDYFIQVFNAQNIILTPIVGHAKPMDKKTAENIIRDLEKSLTTRGMYMVVPL